MTFEEVNQLLTPIGPITSIMTNEERHFLWNAVEELRGVVIEVGSAYGGTTGLLALAGAAKVYSVDNWQCGQWEQCNANLRALKVIDHIKFLVSDSVAAANRFSTASCSLVLIDGNHDAPWPAQDLAAYACKVRIGGILAVDDSDNGHDAVTSALAEWRSLNPTFQFLALFGDEGSPKLIAFRRVA